MKNEMGDKEYRNDLLYKVIFKTYLKKKKKHIGDHLWNATKISLKQVGNPLCKSEYYCSIYKIQYIYVECLRKSVLRDFH